MHDAYKNHKVLKKTSLWNLSLNFLYQIEIDSQTTDNTIRFSPLLQWIFDFKCIYFSDINGHLQQQQPQHQQQQPQHQQQQHQQQQQSVPQIIICNPPAASQSLSQPQQSTPSSFVPNPAPAQQPPSIVILGGQGGNPSSQGNNQLQGRL